jgi:hypothetical protein
VPRESVCPIFGHSFRLGVDAGSMTYSAVTQPPGRSGFIHGGSSGVIDAVHQTIVFPCCHRTDPPGVAVKFRLIVTERSWSLGRPSLRIDGECTARPITLNGGSSAS